MRITKLDVLPINIPLREPFEDSLAIHQVDSDVTGIILKVYSDDGIVGLGECTPDNPFSEETKETAETVLKYYLSPALINEDPFDLEQLLAKMDSKIYGHPYAKVGVDIALHDIVGKALKLPVYKLLGGPYRTRIPVLASCGARTPERASQIALQNLENGYNIMQIKVGFDFDQDVEKVKAVRDAVGNEMKFGLDANQAYTPGTAIRFAKKVERYEIEFFEQPVERWDLDGMARVRDAIEIPIAADESADGLHSLINIIRREAADIITIKVQKIGGLYNAKKASIIAEAAGMPYMFSRLPETGIGGAATIHIASAVKNLIYGAAISPPIGGSLADNIINENWESKDGFVNIEAFDKPGLGVTLNEAKVAKYKGYGLRPKPFTVIHSI